MNGMIMILVAGIGIMAYHQQSSAATMRINANERLLVFAPHPDDEVLGCGGLMQRVKALGGRAGVVYLTAGDGCASYNLFALVNRKTIHRKLGYRRIEEALHAMEYLDVSKNDMAFLGYPDQGLMPLWRMRENPYQEYRSRMTGADYVFYRGTESQGLSYDCESLIKSLALIIERFNPTVILIPSSLDRHPDHRATNYFVKMALKSRRSSPRIFSYLVHYKSWPVKYKGDGFSQKAHWPKGLPDSNDELWLVHTEYQCKIQALQVFRSQHPNINYNFSSFARDEEIFWREDLEIDEDHGAQTKPNRRDIEDRESYRKNIT